jgi:hyaluronoglucosaminidase
VIREIYFQANYRYTINARSFLLETLRLAKLLRPRAKWGYYGYPFCFNYTPNNNRAVCEAGVVTDNDG